MKKTSILLSSLLLATLAGTAQARDTRDTFPIQSLLSSEKAQGVLLDVPLFFGDKTPKGVEKTWGEVSTNKKTNAFGKSDKEACDWVMLSAIKALQERALQEGMNAVVNIKSNYKHREFSSATEFECGAGNVIAGVALKGTLVKMKDSAK